MFADARARADDDPHQTYPPLEVPKPIADGVWIVDGPTIAFGPPGLKLPFPTRATLVRLAGGDLFVHSPTRLTPTLCAVVAELGTPRWLVAPNRIHYWWLPQWHAAWPQAEVWLAPRVREQAKGRIDFSARQMEADHGYPWDAELLTLPVRGRYMTEMVFFHPASRTLLLADLIENFEAPRLPRAWMRGLTRLGRAQDPDGQMPLDMRTTYPRHTLRAALATMLRWNPQQVVLAHGRWYRNDGAAELRRAFRWLP